MGCRGVSPLVCDLCWGKTGDPNTEVVVQVDAHLGCLDDVEEDQVSLYLYD